MKRTITILLALIMVLSLAACGGGSQTTSTHEPTPEPKKEYHPYYEDFSWGTSYDDIVAKLKGRGFKHEKDESIAKKSSDKVFTVDPTWGTIRCYNAEYLDKYAASLEFSYPSNQEKKELWYTFVTLNEEITLREYDELEKTLSEMFGEPSATDSNSYYQKMTDWRPTGGFVRLLYHGNDFMGTVEIHYHSPSMHM